MREPNSNQVCSRMLLPSNVWGRVALISGVLVCLAFIAVAAIVFSSSRKKPSGKALLLTAQAAVNEGRFADALRQLDRIPDDGSAEAVAARCLAGEVLLTGLRRLTAAEQEFRRALAQDADNLPANDRLSYLMRLGTRSWELAPFELAIVRLGRPTPRRLRNLSVSVLLHTDAEFIRECAQIDPHDPTVLLGLADIAVGEQHYSTAEEFLRSAAETHPHPLLVEFRLGQVLLQKASEADFLNWYHTLPDRAIDDPGIWMILGVWAERRNESRVAVRCFWEALQRDPNLSQANYQVGQLLRALGRPDAAEPFLERARRLLEYVAIVQMLNAKGAEKTRNIQDAMRAAELAERLGLLFESCGWFRLSLELDPTLPQAQQGYERLQSRLPTLELTRTIPEANPALKIDLSGYPRPNWNSAEASTSRSHSLGPMPEKVAFEDRAAASGLDFTYFDSHDPAIRGLGRIYELTGGGVAALDYDGDGWPDIYLTQGCPWPPRENQFTHLDRLFRNLGDGRFKDVTDAAGIAENGFSQGVTVGDMNNDGFPDLYVANIGSNRLFRNNGDGTFADVTDVTGTGGHGWTTSCAMADLNGDTWPDIYAVKYLAEPALTTICRNRSGKLNSCLPAQFPAAQDQLYLNLGDGRFQDVTAEAGIVVPDGKGLGIVVADFNGSGKRGVFIANDGVPNFLFVNQALPGERPQFVEQGMAMGVAVNEQGQPLASMGVAAGDADGNGLIDLFVTTFTEESKPLFLQQPGDLFIDATHSSGLRESSLMMLGFGTQFLDGELDGIPDLIVTNGHIDVYDDPHLRYEMRPQYFRNLGRGKFVELPAKTLGRFFEEPKRGRGLARLDWNRDGLEDVVISHLDAPVALLTNKTSRPGHHISISLRGVESDRDAIGTIVALKAGNSTLIRQLTAGDGYQASNERRLVFGLGEATRVTDLEIRWPSGIMQNFEDLPADAEYLFVERRSRPVLQHAPQ